MLAVAILTGCDPNPGSDVDDGTDAQTDGKGTVTKIMERGFLAAERGSGGLDIAVDAAGTPYIALNAYDATLSAETKAAVEVWSYDGTSWTRFGPRVAVTDDEAYAPSIAVHDGTVYVAHEYYDEITDVRYDALTVASSTGSGWNYVGGDGTGSLIKNGSTTLDGYSELSIKDDGTLLVAQVASGDGFVHYFDGTTWVSYNGYTTDSTTFWAGGIDITCFGNTPYVGIQTGSGTGRTGALYGNAVNGVTGEWQWVGSTFASTATEDVDTSAGIVSFALDTAGAVWVAYSAYDTSAGEEVVRVKQFSADAASWSTIYTDTANLEQTAVVVANGIPYVVTVDYNIGITIYKKTDDGWSEEASVDGPDVYYEIKVAAASDGAFYIAYRCTDDHAYDVGVYKYTPYAP